MDPLCARANVYAIGLPPEVFARPPRPIEGVTAASGTLHLRSHGLAADTPITLAVLSSSTLGATPAALPGGLAVATSYYWQPVGSDLGQLSTTSGGSPIASFSTSGSGMISIIVDHGVYLDQAILFATAVLYEHTRAHKAPIAADALPFVCAFLAARIYVFTHAAGNPEYGAAAKSGDSVIDKLLDTLFERWLSGMPVAGAVDATPGVAEMGAKAVRLKGRGFTSRSLDREDLA